MEKMPKISAIVPVRSGSIRVENKNIRPFANTTLLEVKVKTLLACDEVDEVVVNSDCSEMLEMAASYGAVTMKRDPYFASSSVPMNEVYQYLAESLECDIVLHAPVTSPLIRSRTYSNLIQCFLKLDRANHDSLNTVHEIKEFLWLNDAGLNFDVTAIPRSQDLPDVVAFNWAAGIFRRDEMIKRKSIVGARPFLAKIDHTEAFDIDTIEQFEIAEILYQRRLSSSM